MSNMRTKESKCSKVTKETIYQQTGIARLAAGDSITDWIDFPASSAFSMSIISFTPSTTLCTCSTSDEPRRSVLEISYIPPSEAVSTPPVPVSN